MISFFKACLFDLDGLLIDSESLWAEMTAALLKKRGKIYEDEFKYATLGTREDELVPRIKERYGLNESVEELKRERLEEMKKIYNERLQPMTGAVALVRRLAQEGLGLAVVSSSPRELVELALKRVRLFRYFSIIISGADVTRGKPAPDPYFLAAKRLGAVPEACLVFEDAPNGVAAAHAAGMRVIAVPHKDSPAERLKEADVILKSLAEFKLEYLAESGFRL